MKILIAIVFITSLCAAYYTGQRGSSDYVWTQCYALDASHAAHIISSRYPEEVTLEEYKADIISQHNHMVFEGVIGLGRFESTISSKLPFWVGDKGFAMQMLGFAYSKYPEIENAKYTKHYPEEGQLDVFQNKRVDWFYQGLNGIKEAEQGTNR
jgi:hypothetical protein